MREEHNFNVDREEWEAAVIRNAQHFTMFIPTQRGGRGEYTTLREALRAVAQMTVDNKQLGDRAMVYAVTKSGRSVMIPRTQWVHWLQFRGES